MRAMPWVIVAAVVVGIVTGASLDAAHRTGDDPLTEESAREIEEAVRAGRDWEPDDGQSWFVRNPWPSGIGAGLAVLVVGSLVVIAVSAERRPDR
jgi:hypothetical protein